MICLIQFYRRSYSKQERNVKSTITQHEKASCQSQALHFGEQESPDGLVYSRAEDFQAEYRDVIDNQKGNLAGMDARVEIEKQIAASATQKVQDLEQ